MGYFWKVCFGVAVAGLCAVVVPNTFSELAMAFVDIAHAPAKARDGEQY